MTKLKDMSQSDLISWISGLTLGFKNDIITGITSYAEEAEMEIEGSMFVSAGVDDIKEITGLSQVRAISFMKKIAAKKKSDYDTTAPTNNNNNNASSTRIISFTLKVQGKKTYNIPGANKTWTISKCKYEFLRYIGSDGKAELYATHANQKWVSPNKKEGIELKREGKNLSDNVTLDSIGIFNGMHMPLVTTFRVNGGADEKECAEDEYDKIRPRKLNKKLLKDSGVPLSSKPCCIMGYSDIDGILRAEMPCGCSFASDTMFQYMKSLFDKNLKAVKPICPVSKGNGKYDCRGNDKQREWQWGLVFAVADLSDREIARFTKAIENRLGSTKNCPNCGGVTERNDDVRISRVNCSACSGRDWCWNCGKPWNHSGLGPICGNKGCMADRLNALLLPKNCGTIKTPPPNHSWNTTNEGQLIVKTRACPKCLCLLEFVAACKHMKCVSCPHEFCHNCTRDWKKKECSHSIKCTYSGPQQFV